MDHYIKKNYNKFIRNLQQRYPQLTMQDLKYEAGKSEEFFIRLSQITKTSKESLIRELQSL